MDKSDSNQNVSDGVSLGRRNFLRQSVVSLGVTVQEYIKHSDAPEALQETVAPTERSDWLRPPGAVHEEDFLEQCTKCGDCLDVCPHDSIRKSVVDQYPIIFPEEKPCELCEDFPCIEVCETDALLSVLSPRDINMGKAKLSYNDCTSDQGCNACVSKCPHDAIVMDFSGFRLSVHGDSCVGCGLCQKICHAVNDRVAIKVIPHRML